MFFPFNSSVRFCVHVVCSSFSSPYDPCHTCNFGRNFVWQNIDVAFQKIFKPQEPMINFYANSKFLYKQKCPIIDNFNWRCENQYLKRNIGCSLTGAQKVPVWRWKLLCPLKLFFLLLWRKFSDISVLFLARNVFNGRGD